MKSFIIPAVFAVLSVSVAANASTVYGETAFHGKGKLVSNHLVAAHRFTFAPGKHSISLHAEEDMNAVACVLLNPDGNRMQEAEKVPNSTETIKLDFNIKARGTYMLLCEARIIAPFVNAPAMSFTYKGEIR